MYIIQKGLVEVSSSSQCCIEFSLFLVCMVVQQYQSVSLSVSLLSVSQSVSQSVCLSVCLFVCLSVYFSVCIGTQ